jgi:negative regulator of sigma E activity
LFFSELVAMLFFGYFSCLIVAFTAVAMWLVGSFNNSTSEKHYHPRPPIDQTVTAEEIAPLHLQVTKEASAAKDDVSPVKHHKRRVLARARNNYGYGNASGYAEAFRNDPRGFFIH